MTRADLTLAVVALLCAALAGGLVAESCETHRTLRTCVGRLR